MTDDAQPPKKGGRPAKYPGEGKRPTVTFRCRSQLQERLQSSAQESDRSLSEEIERRLEQSFDAREKVDAITREIAASSIDRIFDAFYGDAGGKDNFFAGIQFSRSLAYVQKEADGIFASDEEWFRNTHKRRYVKEEAAKRVSDLIDLLVDRLDPDARKPSGGLSALGALLADLPPEEAREDKENPAGTAGQD